MNTNTNALETYTAELATVDSARSEFDKVPLVKHRRTFSTATQRLASLEQVDDHCATVFGGAIHTAGMKFLESIHADIRLNESDEQKEQRNREDEQARLAEEKANFLQLLAMEREDEEKVAA